MGTQDDTLATLPSRKRLNHRGPLSVDVSSAWYFITICAAERFDYGRAVPMKPSQYGDGGRAVSMKPPQYGDGGGIIDAALPDVALRVTGDGRAVSMKPPQYGDGGGIIDAALPDAALPDVALRVTGDGRAVSMKPPPTPFIEFAREILDAARFRHDRAAWRLALFLIMPDHIHLIAHFPSVLFDAAVSSKPPYRGGMQYVIADLKRWLSTKYGIRFQRDFFDTRLRDDAHFAEKYKYILNNPVRKGLCATPEKWPYSIAFNRIDGRAVSTKPPQYGDGGGIIDAALPDAALPDVALRVTGDGRAVSTKPPQCDTL